MLSCVRASLLLALFISWNVILCDSFYFILTSSNAKCVEVYVPQEMTLNIYYIAPGKDAAGVQLSLWRWWLLSCEKWNAAHVVL
jgi:hypothetical protein